MFRRNKFKADDVRGVPLCMAQFKLVFHATRVPILDKDRTDIHPAYGNEHFAVVSRGKFYTVSFMSPDGRMLSTEEIWAMLVLIDAQSNSAQDVEHAGWGVLTTDPRDVWAENYKMLLAADAKNPDELRRLHTAAFLVCLDSNNPVDDAEFTRALWHSLNPRDRFFDKSIQLIAFSNGRMGFNGEHSLTDGTTTGRICRDAILAVENNPEVERLEAITSMSENAEKIIAASSLPHPSLIDVRLDDEIRIRMNNALNLFDSEAAAHDVYVLKFHHFGKNRLKKYKCSPDAFVQMSFQLAHFRMWGRCAATYESASTRKYETGRTEVARGVSHASMAWIDAIDHAGMNHLGAAERAELLRRAIGIHSRTTALACDGQGMDRHLLGLRLICREQGIEMPAIFTDPAYRVSSQHWTLSTSQVSDPVFAAYGWGEVVSDGYGLAYMILDDFIHVNVCSKGRRSQEMGKRIEMALLDMQRVLDEAERERAGREAEVEEEVEKWLEKEEKKYKDAEEEWRREIERITEENLAKNAKNIDKERVAHFSGYSVDFEQVDVDAAFGLSKEDERRRKSTTRCGRQGSRGSCTVS